MTSTTPVLRVVGLSKRFGPTVALEDVHLVAEPGEVHAIVGENGAGKSTLMNIVSGGMRPDAGGMYVDGRPYEPASPHDGRRRGVALIHQELALCAHLTVAENILLGQEPARRGVIDRAAMRARGRAPGAVRPRRYRSRYPGGAAAARGAAGRRDLPRLGMQRTRAADGRADEQSAAQ